MKLGVALGLACLVLGCSPCPDSSEPQNLAGWMAPDGRALLWIDQINTYAGSSFKYEVSLYLQGPGAPPKHVLWRSHGCPPLHTFWVTDRLIELYVDSELRNPRCEEALQAAQHTQYTWNGYEVKVLPLHTGYKRDLLTDQPQSVQAPR